MSLYILDRSTFIILPGKFDLYMHTYIVDIAVVEVLVDLSLVVDDILEVVVDACVEFKGSTNNVIYTIMN